INISSIVGMMGNVGQTNYAASKAALIGLTKALALEIGSRNVTVNAVAPGFVATAMTDAMTQEAREGLEARIALKRLGTIAALEALDIRVGEILSVENVAGSSKLVRLRVSFGDHTRMILAGLRKERDDPTALAGRQALFVVNLEPKRMAGEISEGMLFDLG